MRSRPSSGRRRGDGPPEFLIDRSLSQVLLPAWLRDAGLIVRTLAEVYGEQAAQEAEDADWLSLAGEHSWVVLCKDDHIRRRPADFKRSLTGSPGVLSHERPTHLLRAGQLLPGQPAQDHSG